MAPETLAARHTVTPGAVVTGAAMDRPVSKRRRRYPAWGVATLLLTGSLAALVSLVPHGLRIAAGDIRVATVKEGMFHDDVVVRSTAEPLHTIMLDVLDTGRVEEVLVNDGASIEKGALLFRLSNPQLRLNLVAREADRAQQISNLSALRVSLETSQTDHQRRVLDLRYSLAQAERLDMRNATMVKSGAVSVADFEDSRDNYHQQGESLRDEEARYVIETRVKRDGVRQLEHAIAQLDDGLNVVKASIDALAVRAPIAGRLTDFRLQLGEIVNAQQRVGRIDDPTRFKLTAQIDEYFLRSVTVGKEGSVTVNGREHPVRVSRVFPQIKDGRFSAELLFTGATPPDMSPGQSAETRITLGGASPGLLLPNDAFYADTGGAWAYVLSADGRSAQRRPIRVGRRNNSQLQIAAGLAPGERVIVSSYSRFREAERLQIAP